MKMWATVSYPVTIECHIDETKIKDEVYLNQKIDQIKNESERILETSTIKSIIVDSNIAELID